jgi:hypothetical protein
MADDNPKGGEKMRALHHFEGFRASCETRLSRVDELEAKHLEYAETGQTDDDQVDGHNEIQEPRHNQDQDSRNQSDNRGNVRSGEGHWKFLREIGGIIESRAAT